MDAVAALREGIVEKLQTREWRAGHRIPAERELGLQFGVGRSAVRRVMQGLKAQGLITQAVGSGTYVSDTVDKKLAGLNAPDTGQAISPADLMSARLVLEPALMDMVTAHANAADFARMDECNAHAEAATTLASFERWDARLHEAIADAAHNSFMSSMFKLMNQVREQGAWGALKKLSVTPERRLEYQQQHRALVAALKNRDAERARALCTAHLVQVRTNMFGS
jgi:DNA-binding FadR family transcriptional regulator